ncbi:MAG: hypothetical protein ACERKZ_05605 [Lachnotalea sp.]
MKIKLFDESVLDADASESEDVIQLTIKLAKVSDYSKVFEALTDSNLSSVVITYEDETHSEYSNLKFTSASLKNKSGTYSVVILLSSKTVYELEVDSLNKVVKAHDLEITENNSELTKTQLAIVEIFESLLV